MASSLEELSSAKPPEVYEELECEYYEISLDKLTKACECTEPFLSYDLSCHDESEKLTPKLPDTFWIKIIKEKSANHIRSVLRYYRIPNFTDQHVFLTMNVNDHHYSVIVGLLRSVGSLKPRGYYSIM